MLSFQSRFSIIELFTLFIIVLALYHRYRSKKRGPAEMTSAMIYIYLMYTMLPVLILCVLGHQISFFS